MSGWGGGGGRQGGKQYEAVLVLVMREDHCRRERITRESGVGGT